MRKTHTAGKFVTLTAAALIAYGAAGNAQSVDTAGFSKIRKFVNSLKSKGPMVDSRLGSPATKQVPAVSGGPTPADIYNSQLSDIADRVNAATDATLPGIERDLARLEKKGGAYLDPYALELVKGAIAKMKGRAQNVDDDAPSGADSADVDSAPSGKPAGNAPAGPDYNGMLENLAGRMSQPGANMEQLKIELDSLVQESGGALDKDALAEVNRFMAAKTAKAQPAEPKPADDMPAAQQKIGFDGTGVANELPGDTVLVGILNVLPGDTALVAGDSVAPKCGKFPKPKDDSTGLADSAFVQSLSLAADTVKAAIDTLKNGAIKALDTLGITQNGTETATLIKRSNLETEIEAVAGELAALARKTEFTAQDSADAKTLIARIGRLETDARDFCKNGANQDILDSVAAIAEVKNSMRKKMKIEGQ